MGTQGAFIAGSPEHISNSGTDGPSSSSSNDHPVTRGLYQDIDWMSFTAAAAAAAASRSQDLSSLPESALTLAQLPLFGKSYGALSEISRLEKGKQPESSVDPLNALHAAKATTTVNGAALGRQRSDIGDCSGDTISQCSNNDCHSEACDSCEYDQNCDDCVKQCGDCHVNPCTDCNDNNGAPKCYKSDCSEVDRDEAMDPDASNGAIRALAGNTAGYLLDLQGGGRHSASDAFRSSWDLAAQTLNFEKDLGAVAPEASVSSRAGFGPAGYQGPSGFNQTQQLLTAEGLPVQSMIYGASWDYSTRSSSSSTCQALKDSGLLNYVQQLENGSQQNFGNNFLYEYQNLFQAGVQTHNIQQLLQYSSQTRNFANVDAEALLHDEEAHIQAALSFMISPPGHSNPFTAAQENNYQSNCHFETPVPTSDCQPTFYRTSIGPNGSSGSTKAQTKKSSAKSKTKKAAARPKGRPELNTNDKTASATTATSITPTDNHKKGHQNLTNSTGSGGGGESGKNGSHQICLNEEFLMSQLQNGSHLSLVSLLPASLHLQASHESFVLPEEAEALLPSSLKQPPQIISPPDVLADEVLHQLRVPVAALASDLEPFDIDDLKKQKSTHNTHLGAFLGHIHKEIQGGSLSSEQTQLRIWQYNEMKKIFTRQEDELQRQYEVQRPKQCKWMTTDPNDPSVSTMCGMRFKDAGDLHFHAKRTHVSSQRKGKDGFVCTWAGCKRDGASFEQKGKLDRHLMTHTGYKIFECAICGRTFSARQTLTQHERTHSGEKPYQCQVCGKRMAQGSALSMHKRHCKPPGSDSSAEFNEDELKSDVSPTKSSPNKRSHEDIEDDLDVKLESPEKKGRFDDDDDEQASEAKDVDS